jgi:hypothetical protein
MTNKTLVKSDTWKHTHKYNVWVFWYWFLVICKWVFYNTKYEISKPQWRQTSHTQTKFCPPVLNMSVWIKCLSLAFFFLGNPNNKTETAYTWGPLIENHLDQSLWPTNQKHWAVVRCNLLHSFWRCTTVLRLLSARASCTNLVKENQFLQLNQHILTFSQ